MSDDTRKLDELSKATEVIEASMFSLKESLIVCADAARLVAETLKELSRQNDRELP